MFIDTLNNNSVVGTQTLSGGQATVKLPVGSAPFGVGRHVISAIYTPDAANSANFSTSQPIPSPTPTLTITGPPSGDVRAANTAVAFSSTYTGANTANATAQWCFDNTTAINGAVSGTSITGSYAFYTAGVYSIMLTAHEAGGLVIANTVNAEMLAEVVVYDPSAGFVTGGGWINSPAEEYIQNRDLSGKASFGFVSNYQKGANVPTGETEFNYQIAGFNFHSTSYQWLVVSGAMVRHYIGSS